MLTHKLVDELEAAMKSRDDARIRVALENLQFGPRDPLLEATLPRDEVGIRQLLGELAQRLEALKR
jgi:hypothetical protein